MKSAASGFSEAGDDVEGVCEDKNQSEVVESG
jgi:hypothetical protein